MKTLPLYVQVKMYEKYAEMQGWRTTVVSLSEVRRPGQGSGASRPSSRVCKHGVTVPTGLWQQLLAVSVTTRLGLALFGHALWDLVTVWVSSNHI